MNKCLKCGHEWPDEHRAAGGKARWKGTKKKDRSSAASGNDYFAAARTLGVAEADVAIAADLATYSDQDYGIAEDAP